MSPDPPEDEELYRWQYPVADISADEFEEFVVEHLEQAAVGVDGARVTLHEVIDGSDGTFDFDATVRYSAMGMDFLVVVEAKRHRNPIKREVLQVLHSKAQSVGAHKAVVISTAPFQTGALNFAVRHGIALVHVTEGRFTFEMRSAEPLPPITREQALEYGIPTFVGHCYSSGESAESISTALITDQPDYVTALLLGPPQP